jgi:hypothetical protein
MIFTYSRKIAIFALIVLLGGILNIATINKCCDDNNKKSWLSIFNIIIAIVLFVYALAALEYAYRMRNV